VIKTSDIRNAWRRSQSVGSGNSAAHGAPALRFTWSC
jgi:hypothetical protein